METLGFG